MGRHPPRARRAPAAQMNVEQLALDGAKRALARAEEHTESELGRLEAENGAHLERLAAYETQKAAAKAAASSGDAAGSSGEGRAAPAPRGSPTAAHGHAAAD